MKTNSRHGKSGFTLIELMAVITIIVILAGLVVGGMGFVNERQAKEKAKVQIALISKALEEYKLDNGTYPPTANTANGTAQSAAGLYIPLFYEGYEFGRLTTPPTSWTKKIGTVDVPKSIKIYLPDLDPASTKQGWVTTGTTVPISLPVMDPWGQQYRYRTAVAANGTPNADTINPDFDLWSSGKDTGTKPETAADRRNLDDIKNF